MQYLKIQEYLRTFKQSIGVQLYAISQIYTAQFVAAFDSFVYIFLMILFICIDSGFIRHILESKWQYSKYIVKLHRKSGRNKQFMYMFLAICSFINLFHIIQILFNSIKLGFFFRRYLFKRTDTYSLEQTHTHSNGQVVISVFFMAYT